MCYWRDIPNTGGLYQVSSDGQVYSSRVDTRLATRLDTKGYPICTVYLSGTSRTYRVHRLVASAFVENPDNKPYVNHIDGNRVNNHHLNLEWCTASENTRHMYKIGNRTAQSGEKATNFKGFVEVLDKYGNIVDTLVGTKDMVDKGYLPSCIANVLAGRRQTHKGFYFRRSK